MQSDYDPLREVVRHTLEGMSIMRRELTQAGIVPPAQDDTPPPASMRKLFDLLDAFPGLVGYLNGRRADGGVTTVESEADVQDLLYLSLKPSFPELVYEQPTGKGAAGYSIGDFEIPSMKAIVEAKYVAGQADVKKKADEVAEDIWKYITQTDCERIVFFIYDPNLLIPDRPNYVRSLSSREGELVKGQRDIEIRTVVKP